MSGNVIENALGTASGILGVSVGMVVAIVLLVGLFCLVPMVCCMILALLPTTDTTSILPVMHLLMG